MSGAPPLVVVGCGVAGLATALSAAPRRVLLLGRAPAGIDCCTALAQGGIAAALDSGDSADAHAHDTLAAGADHNDYDAVRYLVDNAVMAVRWLQAQGVPFDLEGTRFLLGREGGHRRNRIVHAGGDASGASLLLALIRAAQNAPHIDWRPPATLDALRVGDHGVSGLRIVWPGEGRSEDIDCADLVLATGGCGALFAASTNPSGADGNGLALALAAGAQARDLEFVQFHPTALSVRVDGALPLITEALRGAGARLYDDDGAPIMLGHHPLGDLAPRDVVARQVWQAQQAGQRIWLDATHLHETWLLQFPTVYALCRAHGIDPRVQRIPVTPAAHFHMGGIAVDLDGRSAVEGLYAVGEAACNGVHGANRLASNSLLEGVVYGRRLGQSLAGIHRHLPAEHGRWVMRGRDAGPSASLDLRTLTWRALGPVRDGAVMREAREELARDAGLAGSWQGELVTRILDAALARTRSLGAHYRSDAPVD
ncbi:FAD-binding protein [Pseudoxanthomonas sp. z9]|uniref:L-aspartate oxidase n=1 Tax=Pseudoxanthomonas sp. z9 TaxID=2584942 RepID=UPI001143D323|nr:FAD-binding protein [Pseudoxanthomonas sp. z9]